MHDGRRPTKTTTDAVIPAESDDQSLAAGSGGPILLEDHYLDRRIRRAS
jgi:catalase